MSKKDLRSQISDLQKYIHIYVQSNRSSTSSDLLQLEEKLQEKIRKLRAVQEIENKLLNIAEMRKQSDLENYIKESTTKQISELQKDNENLSRKVDVIKKDNDQKIMENTDLLKFRNMCIIEEMAARSFHEQTFSDKLIVPNLEELFGDEKNASDLSEYILNNPNCDVITFCSIILALFDADDTTKIFIQKINDNYSKFEEILPRLIRLYPDTFANKSSFFYKCGFKINEEIIKKARNEIKISLSGCNTKFYSKDGNIQSLKSIFNNESIYNSFIQPRNIFILNYTVEEITDVYSFHSNLAFGMFKPDFMLRNNYQTVKPEFWKEYYDIERVNEFLIDDLNKMIQDKNESKIISYLTKIKDVRENLKRNKNFFAASLISLSKVIHKLFVEARFFNYSQEIRNLIEYFDNDIIQEDRKEKLEDLKQRKLPQVSETQIDFNQGLFYFIPYSCKDELRKKRKGDMIPIKEYFDATVQFLGAIVPFQRPIGPKSIDINLFRDFAIMAQFRR